MTSRRPPVARPGQDRPAVLRAGEGRLINFGGHGAVERLVTPGTQTLLEVIRPVIEPGETLTFPGNAPHTWRNPDVETCEVLWILAPAP